MADSSRSGKIAKNTVFLFIRMIIVMGVALFTSRVILNALGVDDYGIYNVVGGVVVMFSFLKQAMTNATFRYLAYALGERDYDKLQKTFIMAINVHLIIAGLVLLLAETVGLWFLNYHLVFPEGKLFSANVAYQFSILSFCVGIIQTPYNSSILAHEKMSFYAITSIVEVSLKLLIVYLLVTIPGNRLINFTWLLLGISVVIFLWYKIYCGKNFKGCHYRLYWNKAMFKQMINYSGWSMVVNVIDIGVAQSLVFFFNIFFGVAANAALGVANNVNGQLYKFLESFTQSYNPQIIKSYASGDRGYFMRLIFSASKMSYYLLFFISVPVLINIEFILHLWLGLVPEGTGTFIIAVLIYSLINAYSQPLWNAVHATGKLRTHQLLMSGIKILNIPVAYIILKMGFAAWTAIALRAFLNFVCSVVRPIYMKRLIGLSLLNYVKEVAWPIIIITTLILPAPIAVHYYISNEWLRLFASSLTFVAIAMPVIYFLGLNLTERNMLRNAIKGRLGKIKGLSKRKIAA